MRILIITAGFKNRSVKGVDCLDIADFCQDAAHLARREQALGDYLAPAVDQFSGDLHARVVDGVKRLRKAGHEADFHILTAGYGLVPADRIIAPAQCTFSHRLKARPQTGGFDAAAQIRELLATPHDLAVLLLDKKSAELCKVDEQMPLGAPTFVVFKEQAEGPAALHGLRVPRVDEGTCARLECKPATLPGEIVWRVLDRLARQQEFLALARQDDADLVELLAQGRRYRAIGKKVSPTRPDPRVDWVINPPEEWRRQAAASEFHYYIPESDDLVALNEDYDFANDTRFDEDKSNWCNQVYAHQMFAAPNYDGILVSKKTIESRKDNKGQEKSDKVIRLMANGGIHRYLRVPPEFPVMGDCGAFAYVADEVPPYTTEEVIDFYTQYGFNAGVSVDHLISPADSEEKRRFRYDLTLRNARAFIDMHRDRGLTWTPIAAVQGWDAESYAEAAAQCVAMGYRHLALGSMVKKKDDEIIPILRAVHARVKDVPGLRMHLFGVARPDLLAPFRAYGITSADTSSPLIRAWKNDDENYLMPDGINHFMAVRIPMVRISPDVKYMVATGRLDREDILAEERECLRIMHDYADNRCSLEEALKRVLHYEARMDACKEVHKHEKALPIYEQLMRDYQSRLAQDTHAPDGPQAELTEKEEQALRIANELGQALRAVPADAAQAESDEGEEEEAEDDAPPRRQSAKPGAKAKKQSLAQMRKELTLQAKEIVKAQAQYHQMLAFAQIPHDVALSHCRPLLTSDPQQPGKLRLVKEHLASVVGPVKLQPTRYPEDLLRTLVTRPWTTCDCPICRTTGVEVIIFRANNRNRRRGFHNVYQFYRQMRQALGQAKTTVASGRRTTDEREAAEQTGAAESAPVQEPLTAAQSVCARESEAQLRLITDSAHADTTPQPAEKHASRQKKRAKAPDHSAQADLFSETEMPHLPALDEPPAA